MAHIKIDKKITKYRVQKPESKDTAAAAIRTNPVRPRNIVFSYTSDIFAQTVRELNTS